MAFKSRKGKTKQVKLSDFFHLLNQLDLKKSLFVMGLTFSLVTSAANLVLPLLTRDLVDTSKWDKFNYHSMVIIIVIFVVQLVLGTLGGYILRYFGESVVKSLREKLWNHLLSLPISYFDENKAGESSSRLVNDTGVIKDLIASQFPNFITGAIQLFFSLIILFVMDWQMALLMFTIVPIVVLVLLPVGRIMARLGRKLQSATAEFNGDVSEKLSEVRLIKASNGENFEQKHGQRMIQKIFKIGVVDARVEAILQPIMTTLMMAAFAGILAFGLIRVGQGSLSSGSLVAFLLYLFNVIAPVANFATFFSQIQKALGSTERIQAILAIKPEKDKTSPKTDLANKTLTAENLSFSYEPGEPVLESVSFTSKPNSVIAFAGPSGGGKSTIFALIERFYQPDSGKIMIDEQNIAEIDLENWRSQIGYVSQNSAIFSGTIRDNLTYGLPGSLSDAELWRGLALAYADKFVKDFPKQMDTEIGERGIKLSGGQKQRLAIARAFLRDPKILMLDEATASLDSESESKVQQALDKLMVNRTTLVIAHRLATIVNADQIYFIEHGQVTGHGTHHELMKTHPLYARYVNEQMVD
ncbi:MULTISPECIES: ABC transporter ATP-binding protein [Lactobacillus]|uniref:ABC transporter ATP-binding protein n=1 Tax=Lactobacillus TaxID=1578 RepID=UPI00226A43CF|nr:MULTISPECIES: ABC transporter ATP-binding protein [Lactobacillus]MCT6807242.1 ABC transporter ATP-binding protein/permease [Bombilactobacillus sp.]MCO6535087.1 ABC transporter ATP-binding protein [Lactobacillus sp.]MCT6853871.1 ABC transporter ATP-binding protein/permease [Lactobacillus panisapium]MCX8725084.1 ABC transporter ATP-binding protein [Lactobacillus sp. B4007]MCX8735791.1 ABC transporter ATP-binding protein [Lactobacillus sp. B4026]